MPFTVKTIFPEEVFVIICHMVSFAVEVLEEVRARLTCFSFQPRRIDFRVCLVIPSHGPVVLDFVWSSI